MKLFIMAGGQGTKLWPMSRDNLPKQFQKIIGNKSLFRICLEGLLEEFPPEDILISTKKQYEEIAIKDAPEIPKKNYIIEPDYKKNHGPATIYAMLKIKYLYPNEPCMLVQSDDLRIPHENFNEMIKVVNKILSKNKNLFFAGGNKPLIPNMGVDYVEIGSQLKKTGDLKIFKTKRFIQRTESYEKTKELLSDYKVLTHNNHYACYPDRLLKAVKEYKPEWYKQMMEIYESFGTPEEEKITDKVYKEIEAGPMEIVTEHLLEKDGAIVLMPFKWVDIGTWDSVYQYFTNEPTDNYKDGKIITIDSKSNLIKGQEEKVIATIGVNNTVIIDTPDALLVCDKNRTAEVKKVIEKLKKDGDEEYL